MAGAEAASASERRGGAMGTLGSTMLLAGALSAPGPQPPLDSAADFLKLPAPLHLRRPARGSPHSTGQPSVDMRSGTHTTTGGSRLFTHGGARLLEFDRAGKFVREIGQGVYGFLFAQSVRIDPKDNMWVVDRGANMVIKFDSEGRVVMTMGR